MQEKIYAYVTHSDFTPLDFLSRFYFCLNFLHIWLQMQIVHSQYHVGGLA